VVRVLVVVEDDLLIHRLEGRRAHRAKNSFTRPRPSASASMS
jgi:hypothetical protein